MSSVSHTVDRHVSRVFGDVGVGAVLQQQTDDRWISRRGRLVQDRRLILRLGQDIRSCRTHKIHTKLKYPLYLSQVVDYRLIPLPFEAAPIICQF